MMDERWTPNLMRFLAPGQCRTEGRAQQGPQLGGKRRKKGLLSWVIRVPVRWERKFLQAVPQGNDVTCLRLAARRLRSCSAPVLWRFRKGAKAVADRRNGNAHFSDQPHPLLPQFESARALAHFRNASARVLRHSVLRANSVAFNLVESELTWPRSKAPFAPLAPFRRP